MEFINGTMLPSLDRHARHAANCRHFTIPAVTPKPQPLVLQVNAAASGASIPHRRPGPARAIPPPILSGGSMPKGVRLTEDGSAYVRLSIPNGKSMSAKAFPSKLNWACAPALSRRSTACRNSPTTISRSTISPINPNAGKKLINGEPFVLLTWRSMLAVVKPGTFSLSAEVPLTVKIRTRPRRESSLDDRFGDPFWQNFFGATVPKDINVTSPAQELTVRELPAEGRPAGFSRRHRHLQYRQRYFARQGGRRRPTDFAHARHRIWKF